ncbi:MAG: RNA methyltransferase [Oscillatoriales cyanobacterium SM2_2_1]|nr:RNA methyltransferase [Oscillatoriales cyanobacterium SM2_2_1]
MAITDLERVRIVLVQTAGPRNLGSVARVMKNMGIYDLWLVDPQCDPGDPEARQMAVHAQDLLDQVRIVPRLTDALQDCQRAIATVGRTDLSAPSHPPELGLTWLLEVSRGAIVFGAEDRGLSNAELQHCQRVLQIPTTHSHPSLNLAQAVAICAYTLRRLAIDGSDGVTGPPDSPTQKDYSRPNLPSKMAEDLLEFSTIAEREAAYTQLEDLLLRIGFLYPHTQFQRMQKVRCLFERSHLTSAEVTFLRGILRQMSWALTAAPPTPTEQERS